MTDPPAPTQVRNPWKVFGIVVVALAVIGGSVWFGTTISGQSDVSDDQSADSFPTTTTTAPKKPVARLGRSAEWPGTFDQRSVLRLVDSYERDDGHPKWAPPPFPTCVFVDYFMEFEVAGQNWGDRQYENYEQGLRGSGCAMCCDWWDAYSPSIQLAVFAYKGTEPPPPPTTVNPEVISASLQRVLSGIELLAGELEESAKLRYLDWSEQPEGCAVLLTWAEDVLSLLERGPWPSAADFDVEAARSLSEERVFLLRTCSEEDPLDNGEERREQWALGESRLDDTVYWENLDSQDVLMREIRDRLETLAGSD